MNVGKSKVMRCSRYVNVDRMQVRVNSQQLVEVDVLSACVRRKWLRTENVKGIWYTE